MKIINAENLGYAIIFFSLFLYMLLVNSDVYDIYEALFHLVLLIFFAWRFAVNLGGAIR